MTTDHLHYFADWQRDVTADTAWRLARYFGTTPEFWLNLQMQFDLGVRLAARSSGIAPAAQKKRA